jgi:hypothetical protein
LGAPPLVVRFGNEDVITDDGVEDVDFACVVVVWVVGECVTAPCATKFAIYGTRYAQSVNCVARQEPDETVALGVVYPLGMIFVLRDKHRP